MVLSGKLKYHKIIKGAGTLEDPHRTVTTLLQAGDTSSNLSGEAHMGEFLEDTWLIEYKLGTKNGDWTTTDYEPYRKLVRESI